LRDAGDWNQQMFIGFKITHPLSNFQKQLEMYKKEVVEAEEEIKKMEVLADVSVRS
jgi:hypothetical protein